MVQFIEEIKKIEFHLHLLILPFAVTGCLSISGFASLVGIPLVIASSAAKIKICTITAEIKTFKAIIKKKNEET